MTIELTQTRIDKIVKFFEKRMEDEFVAKQDIMDGRDPATCAMRISESQNKRWGANELLNILGIGVSYDFDVNPAEYCAVELYKIATDEVISCKP